ncbi:MAG: anticodon nuclease [Candidatus Hydrogenedentes bacterium]|nr:anticodon nuclease [Candidatus Hydrogenedentota bacterium]
MSGTPTVYNYPNLRRVVERLRDDFSSGNCDFVLLYAYNRTGKTRLSMEFKEYRKRKRENGRDTLYFNAFTEDLFSWDNDLENDARRALQINSNSKFFAGFKDLALEERIFAYLSRYATFNFKIDYENWNVVFSQEIANPKFKPGSKEPETITESNIKISRGEENLFIWCVYLAISELAIDEASAYDWVKYFYIDDPITSLDDNNAIAVATDLANLLRRAKGKIKTVISSHHGLFFNVMFNELKKSSHRSYFIHRKPTENTYTLRATDETPFFHHVATLSELKKASESGELYTYHFNALRSILEKTAAFHGQDDFSFCLDSTDEALYSRALNLLSHGKAYPLYQPVQMLEDNKKLFNDILQAFLNRFEFGML